MARHQTNCHWAIELLEAATIFVAGIATAAVAAVGFLRNGGIAILFLGGLPTVIFFAIGFRLPAIVIAQVGELSHNKVGGGGVGEECAICLCKIGNDGVPTRQLPVCRHVLHRDSIEQWLRVHPTCPICRCKVTRNSYNGSYSIQD
ncbi:RING-H2 finger protein ATL30-like [Panicum miliaceum]|uniref:RING-type E3 ubiquitin transferase n=1 Tax=Panicum miliaceum TaxID=4540 RepID=A0A3L6PED5_PANMI|nr:RING-H2 finger protein ATL30-like [Panicum miliaceum]